MNPHIPGTPRHLAVIASTALNKALEYDRVIIANLDRITDHCNLYAALPTRKSVTIIDRLVSITVTETKRHPMPAAD